MHGSPRKRASNSWSASRTRARYSSPEGRSVVTVGRVARGCRRVESPRAAGPKPQSPRRESRRIQPRVLGRGVIAHRLWVDPQVGNESGGGSGGLGEQSVYQIDDTDKSAVLGLRLLQAGREGLLRER